MSNGFPRPENDYPPLLIPTEGFTLEELGLHEILRHNALMSNEQMFKNKQTLGYMSLFSEEVITGGDGRQYFVLARAAGTDEVIATASLDYTVYFAGGTSITITNTEINEAYALALEEDEDLTDFGILLSVTDGEFDFDYTFEDGSEDRIERFVDDGADPPVQTGYWLPVILEEERASSGGLYEEVTRCKDGSPFQQLIKIG